MYRITSISHFKTCLAKGLISIFGAVSPESRESVKTYLLTGNRELVRSRTGMDYYEHPEPEAIDCIESEHVVEAFDLLMNQRVCIDLGTMPGIAVFAGTVVSADESVFSPFLDEDLDEAPDEIYVAQKGKVIVKAGEAPVFLSDKTAQTIDGEFQDNVVALSGYTVHHKEQGLMGLVIDLADEGEAA